MVQETLIDTIWIFHGKGALFSTGVFKSKKKAEELIFKYGLSGILSEYPLDKLCYDFAIENDLFIPTKPHHYEANTIQKFSPSLEHFHYENGQSQ